MDKLLREEIAGEVKRILTDILEGSKEQWVSGDELGQHISCFSPNWLKMYGRSLPRTRAIVTCKDGSTHQSGFIYPLHKIKRMLANNQVKSLKIE